MKWFNLLFAIKPHPEKEAKDGVLFGYDPPEGHYFDVFFLAGITGSGGWHVKIKNKETNKEVVSACGLTERYDYSRRDMRKIIIPDEEVITTAVRRVLLQYNHMINKQNLVGQYPPKSTQV